MSSLLDDGRMRGVPIERVARLLVPVIFCAAAATFIADLLRTNTLAYGIVYIPLIGTALLSRRAWTLWALTALSITLVAIGAFFPTVDPDLPGLASNRLLSVLALCVTAVLVQHARSVRELLAAETRRAEAAERVRTDVLSNLGREMRIPLHSMTAILGLLLATCSSDQREALQKMRAGVQQLLLTIDNLIGLTQIEEEPLAARQIDVAALLRDAANNAGPIADDSGVAIELGRHVRDTEHHFVAFADPKATRNILDNMLFNAVRMTQRSRTACVSLRQDGNEVIVSLAHVGVGVPTSLAVAAPHDPAAMADALMTPAFGVGLTLGRRLAEAMDGTLTVETDPDEGTIVRLRLPIARSSAPAKQGYQR
jgi:signal transduction histidine kinase